MSTPLTRRVIVSLGLADSEANEGTVRWYSAYADIPLGDDRDDVRAVTAWLAAHPEQIQEA